MKIINIGKAKIILFLLVIIFISFVFISFLHISCKNKVEEEKSLILEPAPEILLTPSYLRSLNSSSKYTIDDNGNVIFIDEFDRKYIIDDNGTVYETNNDNERKIVENKSKQREILELYEKAITENNTIKNLVNPNAINFLKNALENHPDDSRDDTNSITNNNATKLSLPTLSQFKNSKQSSSYQDTTSVKRDSFLIPINDVSTTSTTNNNRYTSENSLSSKEELTERLTSSLKELNKTENDYEIQNSQHEKLDFLNKNIKTELTKKSPNNRTIAPGTIIPITLITGINSDLPGSLLSQISTNVYDTATGSNLLIHKGAKLIGKYDSSISYSQERLIVIWDTLIETDGSVYNIPSLIGIDKDGKSGWSGSVDKHIWNLLSSMGLSTVINLGTTVLNDKTDSTLLNTLLSATSKSASSVGSTLITKQINKQPTIKIDRGSEFNVIVTAPLEF